MPDSPAVPLTALLVALLVGLVLGAALCWLALRARTAPAQAALAVERDLLARRVADLEAGAEGRRALESALSPVAATLGRVEEQVRVLERDRVEQYARLAEQLGAVRSGAEALRGETARLAGALRSPGARGAWGEVQLRRVVEHAGMLERVDFSEQVAGTSREGRAVRPDLVVHLPGERRVVVDAKAPLAALLEAQESDDPARRAERLRAHARALRQHVDALAAKEYWTAWAGSAEFVVCFVPGESLLAAACEADPALLEHAMARRVVLATPTTLLALLRTVALAWQQDAVAGSAEELLALGRELHERLGTLGGHASALGRTLHRAVEDYNRLVGTLERRVLVSARRLRDLGGDDVPVPEPLQDAVRPLTAPELVEDAHRPGAQPGTRPGADPGAGAGEDVRRA